MILKVIPRLFVSDSNGAAGHTSFIKEGEEDEPQKLLWNEFVLAVFCRSVPQVQRKPSDSERGNLNFTGRRITRLPVCTVRIDVTTTHAFKVTDLILGDHKLNTLFILV